jgi:predicted phosphodiesterase
MRLALIADVHANAPALEAVLDALAGVRIDRVVCLGDLVGYNAEPASCIATVREAAHVVVAGNHDLDCARSETTVGGTSPLARQVQEWTRSQLSADDRAYLAGLPAIVEDPAGFVAVHGCYLNTLYYTGYVTNTMLEANLRAIAARGGPPVGLCGHTHVPLCGWLVDGSCIEPLFFEEVRWPTSVEAVLVNPGSVGQPRDGDPRASFVVLDLDARTAEVRRVAYDVDRAVATILAAGLPSELGQRLREGR